MKRSYCGELSLDQVDQQVRLCGWVHRIRDLGGMVFLHLRDRSGLTQVVTDPSKLKIVNDLHPEYVLEVTGKVAARPSDQRDDRLTSGAIEVHADEVEVLNSTIELPFSVEREELLPGEETRLKFRYLDLRRPVMTSYMELRHRMMQLGRNFLTENGFWEVETPILAKSTPEGARDFLVPSRTLKKNFYALPQSPQIYKQLLMVCGLDRYFQWARCLRDEDLRADRQPEHTQVDIEASFVDEENIQKLVEGLFSLWVKEIKGKSLELPLARINYGEAMNRFGSDKPDMRNPLELETITDRFKGSQFRIFAEIVENGGDVRCLRIKGGAACSRKDIDSLAEEVKPFGFPGVAWVKVVDGKLSGPLSRFMNIYEFQDGELFLALAGTDIRQLNQAMSRLRDVCARKLNLIDDDTLRFVWITDFPMFELDADSGEVVPAHHIFTVPQERDLQHLESDPLKVRGRLFDMVLNGTELGSGSIRCHNRELQEKLMCMAGMDPAPFEFFLKALEMGAPPHGGIGMGFDRIVAVFAGLDSIRDTIAFPKTTSGQGLLEGQPAAVSKRQLDELGLRFKQSRKKKSKGDKG